MCETEFDMFNTSGLLLKSTTSTSNDLLKIVNVPRNQSLTNLAQKNFFKWKNFFWCSQNSAFDHYECDARLWHVHNAWRKRRRRTRKNKMLKLNTNYGHQYISSRQWTKLIIIMCCRLQQITFSFVHKSRDNKNIRWIKRQWFSYHELWPENRIVLLWNHTPCMRG